MSTIELISSIFALAGILIMMYKINIRSIERNKENQMKILAIESDIVEMKIDFSTLIDKFETINREDHRLMFDKIDTVGKGVASIEGYLKSDK